jgi:hypothetical protein
MDSAEPFIGGEATFKKREAEMVKRLVYIPTSVLEFLEAFNGSFITDFEVLFLCYRNCPFIRVYVFAGLWIHFSDEYLEDCLDSIDTLYPCVPPYIDWFEL